MNGDVEEAICSHAIYYAIWRKYGAIPERFNWNMKAPDVKFYPLRPEFSESTYLLYQVCTLYYKTQNNWTMVSNVGEINHISFHQ